MTPTKRRDEFLSITPRENYDSIQTLHRKHDEVLGTMKEHDEKIKNHDKLIWGIFGVGGTVVGAVLIFLLLSGVRP